MATPAVYWIHDIDPVAFCFLTFPIHWYALMFLTGFLSALKRFARWAQDRPQGIGKTFALSDFAFVSYLGILVGARLGSFLFYPYLYHWAAWCSVPGQLIWGHGAGMTFQGGLLGLGLSAFLFSYYHGIPFWRLSDGLALVAPRAIFWGRLGNFLASELYGRPSQLPWAVIFHRAPDPIPRHPSQLYEACLEGVVLTWWMESASRRACFKVDGAMTRLFMFGYASLRICAECFREPDGIWNLAGLVCTSGQLLCVPMLVFGLMLAKVEFVHSDPSNESKCSV